MAGRDQDRHLAGGLTPVGRLRRGGTAQDAVVRYRSMSDVRARGLRHVTGSAGVVPRLAKFRSLPTILHLVAGEAPLAVELVLRGRSRRGVWIVAGRAAEFPTTRLRAAADRCLFHLSDGPVVVGQCRVPEEDGDE